jgi:threonine/homoserine/homoserine lactone efflux protein
LPELALGATIRWGALVPLLATALAIMGSPGPATISLTAAGSTFGVRRSSGYLVGIVAGTALVLLAVASGITAALLAAPGLQPLLVLAAGGYVLWLAYHIATAPPLAAREADAQAPALGGGVLLGVANPKAWVAIAAVFASVRLSGDARLDATVKTAALALVIVLVNAAWLAAGASLAPLLREPRRARGVNVALALALVAATAAAVLR